MCKNYIKKLNATGINLLYFDLDFFYHHAYIKCEYFFHPN